MARIRDEALRGKTVLVIGFARQGQALARWLPTRGARVIVTDDRPRDAFTRDLIDAAGDAELAFGGFPPERLAEVDLVCASGAVPVEHPLMVAAFARGIPVANDAQLFFTHCPAPIIGVTGSAGKSTTTALIGHLLRASGLTTWVGGNIGHVLLDDLDGIAVDDVVVMELSSFQLELMSRSPSIAVVTNITPNHLDRHGTMERYIAAKASILAHQGAGDAAVLNRDDAGSRPLAGIGKGQRVWFSLREPVASSAYLENDRLMLAGSASPDGNPVAVASIADVPLPGRHNLANALAACAATGLFLRGAGRWPADARALQPALATFRAIPHRLEVVRVLDGVTYVNDSIATSPDRLLAALRSFEAPIVLLLGGADKDIDWTEIVPAIVERARVVIVFGERAPKRVAGKVLPLLEAAGLSPDRLVHRPDVATAFAQARVAARSGDIVLFSPGGTSYDAYTDFEARGAHFRDLVTRL